MSNTLLVYEGTPEQRAAAQELWATATFPRGFLEGHQVKLYFTENVGSAYTARGGSIVMGAHHAPSVVGPILLHEVGHLGDFWCLDPAKRVEIINGYLQHFSEWGRVAAETWAHSFASAYTPPSTSYPTYPIPVATVKGYMDQCGEGENMASSEQIRKWYHQGVVLNHSERNTSGYLPICNHKQPKVGFPNNQGGQFREPVHPLTVKAWEAYVQVMKDMGVTMPSAGGVNSCRNIGAGDMPSLHAYLCAVDIPPNDYKPQEFIDAIEEIRTNSGAQVFRNLAGDRMHDQINCSPIDLATGIQGDDMAIMDPETQQFWVDVKKELDKLDPATSASWGKAVIEHVRANPVEHIQPDDD